MADRGREKDGVGYRRPPPWGKFRKGQSGNPKGRPKGKRKMRSGDAERISDQVLRELVNRTYELDENGRKRMVAMLEVIRRKQIALAAGGNVHAIRHLQSDIEKMEAREAAAASARAEAEELARKEEARREARVYALARELRKAQDRKWEEAIADGKEEPDDPWPHPDDIILDSAKRTVRIRGPMDAGEVADAERIRDERDHYLAEMVLAMQDPDFLGVDRLWLMSVVQLDALLPKRWQISHDIDRPMTRLVAKPLHRLRRLVEEGRRRFAPDCIPVRRTKEEYRKQNTMFLPLVKALGYRSLRHFEHALEEEGSA